jgi:hypothetical protein
MKLTDAFGKPWKGRFSQGQDRMGHDFLWGKQTMHEHLSEAHHLVEAKPL